MLRHRTDMRIQLREKVCDGIGVIECRHLFEPEEMPGKARLCAIMTLKPGDSIGLHPHESEAEIYYLISGELSGTDTGDEVRLRPGDAMYTTNNESHSVKNCSSENAVLMAIVIL